MEPRAHDDAHAAPAAAHGGDQGLPRGVVVDRAALVVLIDRAEALNCHGLAATTRDDAVRVARAALDSQQQGFIDRVQMLHDEHVSRCHLCKVADFCVVGQQRKAVLDAWNE